jgi:hypothetical protein
MLVELLFWFHPFVWWIKSRLVEEQERACNEAVLRLGQDPHVYVESILKICEYYIPSPLACVSGITGADLKIRVRQIMTHHQAKRVTLTTKGILTLGGLLLLTFPFVLGSLQAKALEFEVVSIKPSAHIPHRMLVGCHGVDNRYPALAAMALPPLGRCVWYGYNLRALINRVYDVGLPYGQAKNLIIGGDKWLDDEDFDTEATVADPSSTTESQMIAMMQKMLADRFKLTFHYETKETTGLALVVGKVETHQVES